MSEIKPEHIFLIEKCISFYANEENYEKLIPLDRGAMARNILSLIDKINKENSQPLENLQSEEEILVNFLKNIDDFKK